MKRSAPANLDSGPELAVQPSADNTALALRDAAVLMAPVALWLLRHGVAYPAFAEALKPVFLEAARREIERAGATPTQSALSMLSGVHRKDVRVLMLAPGAARPPPRPPLAAQVFTRWLTDRRYRAADAQPRALPRSGGGRSFEALCRELSSDVHPRTVLDELLRLGLVVLDGERVVVTASAFVPAAGLEEMTALFAANAADHLAAAVANLTLKGPKNLEQSIYADGLTPASVEVLEHAAREAWARAFEAVVNEARSRVDHDAASDGNLRMRFGVYFFSEPAPAPKKSPAAAADKSLPPRKRARARIKP